MDSIGFHWVPGQYRPRFEEFKKYIAETNGGEGGLDALEKSNHGLWAWVKRLQQLGMWERLMETDREHLLSIGGDFFPKWKKQKKEQDEKLQQEAMMRMQAQQQQQQEEAMMRI